MNQKVSGSSGGGSTRRARRHIWAAGLGAIAATALLAAGASADDRHPRTVWTGAGSCDMFAQNEIRNHR